MMNKVDLEVITVPTVPTVPTKGRIDALLINNTSYYSTKLVIGLGIALTTCGSILCLFGVVYAFVDLESTLTSVYCETWIGVWVIINGFISVMYGSRPHSSCQLYVYMLSSLVTIGLTGGLSILIINSVIHYNEFDSAYSYEQKEDKNIDLLHNTSYLLINSLTLIFSILSFIISIVSFCISSHKVCQCYSQNKFGQNIFNCNLDPDSMCRRDRILEWIIQQSDLQFNKTINLSNYDTISYVSKKKLEHLNSTSTTSTRLSAYDNY